MTTTTDLAAEPRAGRAQWIGLAVLSLPTMLLTMDLTVLHLAVPQLAAELRPSASQLLWITDIYGFLIAGFLITMGTLGDRIGRRRLLMIGAAAFAGASVLAAYASSAELLIAARALMGLAGATLMPSTLALIRNMFHDPAQRSAAIGVWMMGFMVGGAVGPLVGGLLLEHFWWGSVFLLAVPVMVLLLAVGPLLLPEYRDPAPGRLDLASVAMSLVAVLAAVYGIKQLAENGMAWSPVLVALVGLAVGAVFVTRQRTLQDPLLDLQLFRERSFSVALGVMSLGSFIMMGFSLFIAQYLQLVMGLSPFRAGLWTLPMVGGMMIGLMAASATVRRIRAAYVIGIGLLVSVAGFVIMATSTSVDSLAPMVIGSFVFALGISPAAVLGTDIVVASAPPERAGSASAVSETSNELGGALGLAVLGSVGTAVYRVKVDESLPAGLPEDVAETTRDTLGGAASAVGELSAARASEVLVAARDAYTDALQLTAGVSAAILVVAAVVVVALLRTAPKP